MGQLARNSGKNEREFLAPVQQHFSLQPKGESARATLRVNCHNPQQPSFDGPKLLESDALS